MKQFTGLFADVNDRTYCVEINALEVIDYDEPLVDLQLGKNPVNIAVSSGSVFDPIKSRSATIEIGLTKWYFELYEPKARGTEVKIYEYSGSVSNVVNVLFWGYLKPCVYDQSYQYYDTVELEAVDAVSTAKEFKWVNDGSYKTFFDIIRKILKDCGYKKMYVPHSFTQYNSTVINTDILSSLYASSANFVDDDEAHTPWTEYEVLFELTQFLGWSLCPMGEDVWFVDYRAENGYSVPYSVYNLVSGSLLTTYNSSASSTPYNLNIAAAGESSISIDDIYNKIEISDSLYEVEDITPDIFDDGTHISVTEEAGIGLDGARWTHTETKKFLWWTTSSNTTITGYDYQTFCRLNPSTNWKHFYYKTSDLSELPNTDGKGYHNSESSARSVYGTYDNQGNPTNINSLMNTHGCLIQHYAYRKEEGKNNLPSSLDWTDILTFFVANDKTRNFSINDVEKFEKKVLEYETTESINWKPASGISWITIKGDLLYQYNGVRHGDKDKQTLTIINSESNPLFYCTAPVDKAVEVNDKTYCSIFRKNDDVTGDAYGQGFSVWKMRLKIDNKYWTDSWNAATGKYEGRWVEYNGSEDTAPTFYIRYNNNPGDNEDESLPAFKWMSTTNNTNFKDKVGVDAYCIPISATDEYGVAPAFGTMKLTIFTPSLMPNELKQLFKQNYSSIYADLNWTQIPPVIYCKDFELGYVYTDTGVWWNNHEDNDKQDKVYIGYIDEDFVNEFDKLTFKLNTALQEKPISRSFVSTANGYLNTLYHRRATQAKVQEYNVIDEYLDHHSERKPILEVNVHGGYRQPNETFTTQSLNGIYLIDSQQYNVKQDNNTIKLIAY